MKRWLWSSVLSIFLLCLTAGALAGVRVVLNPYAGVDWATIEQHKANLHTHTTQSDGGLRPDQVIDEYHNRGYTILALTDHNACTWPWTGLATLKRGGDARKRDLDLAEKKVDPKKSPPVPAYTNRDPKTLGMLAIPGNELSRHPHINCLFIDFETDSKSPAQSLKEVAQAGGLAVVNHPGRSWWRSKKTPKAVPETWMKIYLGWFRNNDILVGGEIINKNYLCPQDRNVWWDAMLTALMPDRPVWGFANDDMHHRKQLGLNWNLFLLTALKESELRDAVKNGRSYFSTISTHPQKKRDVKQTPVIQSIVHDAQAGTITITAVSGGKPVPAKDHVWISAGGKKVHVGPVLDYRRTEGLKQYVRAEILGSGGTTFTNPIGLKP
ncbi:MAG: hypothetical protein JXA11_14500 [Phycisphaerae bacterium]|nr:hypothetical protein [Phycisphaerae bacterium]